MSAPSLEDVFTSRHFFGIEDATPVQRAICRIAQGRPLEQLAEREDVRDTVGGEEALAILAPGDFRPREVDLLSGIRAGKSFFVAAHQVWSSWTVNLDSLRPGEIPRYPVQSINLRSAAATFNILAGTMMSRPSLKRLLVGDVTGDTLFIKHPSGRSVECTITAGQRAGANLVSVWLAGVGFEEHARQAGEAAGSIVNYEEQIRSVAGRVLEGGQILSVGSPWAPSGPAFERFSTGFGRPSAERVVIKAPGPVMNPVWWTPTRCEALRKSNPTAYTTDVLAGFADPSTAALAQSDVRHAVRKDGPVVMPRQGTRLYIAAMDPGGRANAFTLVIIAAYRDEQEVTRHEVVLAKQWMGATAAPLSYERVLGEIAKILASYGLQVVFTDQFSADALRALGARLSVDVRIRTVVGGNQREDKPVNPNIVHRNDMYETMGGIFATRAITIPDDRVLINDLLSVSRVTTRTGIAYDLPQTADGRHCDYAAALALALAMLPSYAQTRQAEARRRRDDELAVSVGRTWLANAEQRAAAAFADASPAAQDRYLNVLRLQRGE